MSILSLRLPFILYDYTLSILCRLLEAVESFICSWNLLIDICHRYINYCVRWESTTAITADQRAAVETKLQGEFQKWMQYLIGYDGFPYSSVPVKVVGWAATSTSLFSGSLTGYDFYTTLDSVSDSICRFICRLIIA